ncbi:MAG: PstS family phosphate ABC transporter substrate-binding protein [Egibacteraceae bacterium]
MRRIVVVAALALLVVACGGAEPPAARPGAGPPGEQGELSGSIVIDGSSTVGPLTEALAEEFRTQAPDVIVNISQSGTGGGFERFCGTGDTQISNASRPISEEEAALCEQNGIEYTELRVGTDALTMVTSPQTEFVDCLTTDELVKIWGPGGAKAWNEVNPKFPAQKLQIFAPGADSGTYDFFNETVLEPAEIEQPRQDYSASEDDNIIAQGVIGTPGSWGFFGFAYFQENKGELKDLAYDAGDGCVKPSAATAQDGSYKLTRPLFIYVRNDALAQPHVTGFTTYYLDHVNDVIGDVGYIPEPDRALASAKDALGREISRQQPGESS